MEIITVNCLFIDSFKNEIENGDKFINQVLKEYKIEKQNNKKSLDELLDELKTKESGEEELEK